MPSWIPTEPESRARFFEGLIRNFLDPECFLCPHCQSGMGEFHGKHWKCPVCPAGGTWESLAISLDIDP